MTKLDPSSCDPELLARLPWPPTEVRVPKPDKVCIVEWLSDRDNRTGSELHAWLEGIYPDSSLHYECNNKQEFLDSIESITEFAASCSQVPLLHLEAHGNEQGLAAERDGAEEQFLSWDELVEPFQALNLGTRCNLIIFVAACVGFSGILAFSRGPRVPAVAMVGPDSVIGEKTLLSGTKELYRRLNDTHANLTEAVESVSREICPAGFAIEPMACMAFESMISALVNYKRNELPPVDAIQYAWNELFMMDIEPANADRFGVDMSQVLEIISEWLRESDDSSH